MSAFKSFLVKQAHFNFELFQQFWYFVKSLQHILYNFTSFFQDGINLVEIELFQFLRFLNS